MFLLIDVLVALVDKRFLSKCWHDTWYLWLFIVFDWPPFSIMTGFVLGLIFVTITDNITERGKHASKSDSD